LRYALICMIFGRLLCACRHQRVPSAAPAWRLPLRRYVILFVRACRHIASN
jgi:hypothetical protein